MVFKVWILATFISGTFGLPKPAPEMSALYHHSGFNRVLGGIPADDNIPYMVALTAKLDVRRFFCGGSLVTTRTVLTAAHCIDAVFSHGRLNSSLRATVGTNRLDVPGVSYRIMRNITHPNYSKKTAKNDIGLLITTAKVKLSNNVRTVPLYFDFIDSKVETRVTGWGKTESGAQPEGLQQLSAYTVDGKRCKTKMSEVARELDFDAPRVEPRIELCTFHSKNHGTCHGDSGGPLVLANQEQQIGIVSWTLPCALGAPDVFVRISAYKDWLQRNIR